MLSARKAEELRQELASCQAKLKHSLAREAELHEVNHMLNKEKEWLQNNLNSEMDSYINDKKAYKELLVTCANKDRTLTRVMENFSRISKENISLHSQRDKLKDMLTMMAVIAIMQRHARKKSMHKLLDKIKVIKSEHSHIDELASSEQHLMVGDTPSHATRTAFGYTTVDSLANISEETGNPSDVFVTQSIGGASHTREPLPPTAVENKNTNPSESPAIQHTMRLLAQRPHSRDNTQMVVIDEDGNKHYKKGSFVATHAAQSLVRRSVSNFDRYLDEMQQCVNVVDKERKDWETRAEELREERDDLLREKAEQQASYNQLAGQYNDHMKEVRAMRKENKYLTAKAKLVDWGSVSNNKAYKQKLFEHYTQCQRRLESEWEDMNAKWRQVEDLMEHLQELERRHQADTHVVSYLMGKLPFSTKREAREYVNKLRKVTQTEEAVLEEMMAPGPSATKAYRKSIMTPRLQSVAPSENVFALNALTTAAKKPTPARTAKKQRPKKPKPPPPKGEGVVAATSELDAALEAALHSDTNKVYSRPINFPRVPSPPEPYESRKLLQTETQKKDHRRQRDLRLQRTGLDIDNLPAGWTK